jgi:hypothetical protein
MAGRTQADALAEVPPNQALRREECDACFAHNSLTQDGAAASGASSFTVTAEDGIAALNLVSAVASALVLRGSLGAEGKGVDGRNRRPPTVRAPALGA